MYLLTVQLQLGGHAFNRASHPGESSLWKRKSRIGCAGWNRKTGTGQGLTWLSARFMLGGYSIVYSIRVTSMYVCSGDSNHNFLVRETDTHGEWGNVSAGWGAVGERLVLEKNV